jgi:hypothetical protein
MIISKVTSTSRTLDRNEEVRWRSLARRGMLHSECESFDYVQLAPGTTFALRGQDGTESAWFVVAGAGVLVEAGASPRSLIPRAVTGGHLVLVPAGQAIELVAGDDGLQLLWLELMPGAVVEALPGRRPVA